MKLTHSIIGFVSIVLGVTFSYSVRALTQPLSTIPFLPLGVSTVIYNNKEYKADLLYTNVGGEGWLVCVAGVYKAEFGDNEIHILEKLESPVKTECP